MQKHQQFFLAMEQRIDNGDFLFQELEVACEQYDQANNWLVAMESGDHSVATAILDTHSGLISAEGVSMEGVQVHLNSSQVQAIVDFLRKWIPIVLQKLRDIIKQVYKWAKERLRNLDGRIAALLKKLKGVEDTKTLNFNILDNPIDRLAWHAISTKDWRWAEINTASMKLWYAGQLAAEIFQISEGAVDKRLAMISDNLSDGMHSWLSFGRGTRIPDYSGGGTEAFTQWLRNDLPSPEELLNEGQQALLNHLRVSDGVQQLKKNEVEWALTTLQVFARKLPLNVADLERYHSETARDCEKMYDELSKDSDPEKRATATYAAAKPCLDVVQKQGRAATVGLNFRMKVLDLAIGKMEMALR